MRISAALATISPQELSALRLARPSGESDASTAPIRAALSACAAAVADQPLKERRSGALVMPLSALRSCRLRSTTATHVFHAGGTLRLRR